MQRADGKEAEVRWKHVSTCSLEGAQASATDIELKIPVGSRPYKLARRRMYEYQKAYLEQVLPHSRCLYKSTFITASLSTFKM